MLEAGGTPYFVVRENRGEEPLLYVIVARPDDAESYQARQGLADLVMGKVGCGDANQRLNWGGLLR